MCIVHDLGEAISGDIPAIHKDPSVDKSAQEHADLRRLFDGLPTQVEDRIVSLWLEYETGITPEARSTKGLDKIETMLQHVTGRQAPGFDYLWNLGYGVKRTDKSALLRDLRAKVDALTKIRAQG